MTLTLLELVFQRETKTRTREHRPGWGRLCGRLGGAWGQRLPQGARLRRAPQAEAWTRWEEGPTIRAARRPVCRAVVPGAEPG